MKMRPVILEGSKNRFIKCFIYSSALTLCIGWKYMADFHSVTNQVECETHTATDTWRQSCELVGQRCATLASDPLTHASKTPLVHFSSPPPTHAPLQVCLQLNGGRGGHWGCEGIRCHLKKQLSGLAENGA